jgi:hypothetical protein
MLPGGIGWHIMLLIFNQGVTGSRPVRPTAVANRMLLKKVCAANTTLVEVGEEF